MKAIFLILLLASMATAYDYYFYNNENDLHDNVESALYNPYDAYDIEDAADFDNYECVSLDDYNYYANLNQNDAMEPLTAHNIGSRFDDLKYEDQLRIINENPYDKWDMNDVSN